MKMMRCSIQTCAMALVFLFIGATQGLAGSPGIGENSMSHHINMLVLQLSAILVAAWLGGRFFKRMKFPPVLGELVAGVVIGPYCLGQIILPGLPQGLFPVEGSFPVSLELYSFATIASIVLLFLAGLETELETFLQYSFIGSVVGIFGVIFSFIAGDIVGVFLMRHIYGVSAGYFDIVPLFLGVISTATSVGISARILSDKRRLNAPEGVTILAAAVIDDVLGIIILSVVVGMVKTHTLGWVDIVLIIFKAVGMWLLFTFLGIRYARQIGGALKHIADRNMIAIIALAMALFVSGVFEKSGLALIIGAYVMGLSLSKTDLSFLIQEKLEPVQRLLVPVFFCVMGMLINLEEIASPLILKFGLIYITAAVLGKVIGCGLPSLFLNFNARGALRVGIGMVPRGEVALIIAGIGLSMGIIDDKVFSLAVMMTFVTTLFTPPVFDRLLNNDRPVLRKKRAEGEKSQTSVCFKMPNAETATLLLSLLVPAFEEEGFYVHCLEGAEKLYHIRKDQTFITLRYKPHDFIFDCAQSDVTFIHTLFYEVIAEVDGFMQRLQALTDKRDIGKNILQNSFASERLNNNHNLQGFLSPMAVEINLKGVQKEEILREMLGLLVRSNAFNESIAERIFRELKEREILMSTGMQDGVALPHVKTDLVDHIRFAVGIKKEGMDFESLDNKPSKIFILAVAPKKGHESYLQYLAEISKFLATDENRQRLVGAQSNKELFEILFKGF